MPVSKKPAKRSQGHADGMLPQGCGPVEKLAALEALANAQGIRPIHDPKEMIADFWPEDESIDDFVAAVRCWRAEGRNQR